jgi:transposase
MAIVAGLDQHRGQITAEWIDTNTGELGRARRLAGAPRRRADFSTRFAGQPLEVALEATTGWRFVVEELHAIGAAAHLATPACTRRGRAIGRRRHACFRPAKRERAGSATSRLRLVQAGS